MGAARGPAFGCLLDLTGQSWDAQWWWQFAAGAGDLTAAYCLYLHQVRITVVQHAALITAASACWYALAVSVSAAAITAVAARNADRRRDAREVLKVLVRRGTR
ncbi:hypothetical protein ACIBCA_21005 [Kitasatospora sp. NPDC051170]|uniref:hypothetical protein n=1 Tax=Kitasatospora sp. NPDC051170 TaxID=3364056 RepID=UPI003792931E